MCTEIMLLNKNNLQKCFVNTCFVDNLNQRCSPDKNNCTYKVQYIEEYNSKIYVANCVVLRC